MQFLFSYIYNSSKRKRKYNYSDDYYDETHKIGLVIPLSVFKFIYREILKLLVIDKFNFLMLVVGGDFLNILRKIIQKQNYLGSI